MTSVTTVESDYSSRLSGCSNQALCTEMASSPPAPGSEVYTSGYDANLMKMQMAKTPEVQAAFLLPYLKPGQALLDCGCGPGGLSLGFARLVSPGGRLDGIDREAEMVHKANEAAEATGLAGIAKFHQVRRSAVRVRNSY